MTIDLKDVLPILLYIALIVLVIYLIIFVVRLLKTLNRVDVILDDVNHKLVKVDGVFDLIDHTTDAAAGLSDKIINGITSFINSIFARKKGR